MNEAETLRHVEGEISDRAESRFWAMKPIPRVKKEWMLHQPRKIRQGAQIGWTHTCAVQILAIFDS